MSDYPFPPPVARLLLLMKNRESTNYYESNKGNNPARTLTAGFGASSATAKGFRGTKMFSFMFDVTDLTFKSFEDGFLCGERPHF